MMGEEELYRIEYFDVKNEKVFIEYLLSINFVYMFSILCFIRRFWSKCLAVSLKSASGKNVCIAVFY